MSSGGGDGGDVDDILYIIYTCIFYSIFHPLILTNGTFSIKNT
jgi:hypothetical protein